MKQSAWIAGASGLVGQELCRQLATHPAYDRVTALIRDDMPALENIEGLAIHRVNYGQLRETLPSDTVDHVYCALGSTRARTPDQGDFRTVDVLHPLSLAKVAAAAGAQMFAVISAPGAHPFSRFKYLQLKGELESRLIALDMPKLVIAQPGLLLGHRAEHRPVEDFFAKRRWLHRLMPARTRPIPASSVARAMIHAASKAAPGVHTLGNSELTNLASHHP